MVEYMMKVICAEELNMEDMEDIEDMVVMGTMDEEEDIMETLKMKDEDGLFFFCILYKEFTR